MDHGADANKYNERGVHTPFLLACLLAFSEGAMVMLESGTVKVRGYMGVAVRRSKRDWCCSPLVPLKHSAALLLDGCDVMAAAKPTVGEQEHSVALGLLGGNLRRRSAVAGGE